MPSEQRSRPPQGAGPWQFRRGDLQWNIIYVEQATAGGELHKCIKGKTLGRRRLACGRTSTLRKSSTHSGLMPQRTNSHIYLWWRCLI